MPDIILGGNDNSGAGDDGRIISDPQFASSDIIISSNDAVVIDLDENNDGEDADFQVRDRLNKVIFGVDESGNAALAGTLTEQSDRNSKVNIAAADVQAILTKVLGLPISTWAYKQDPSVNHIGPMAQDFKDSFNVGADETSISTIDRDGVALAAIQGLYQVMLDMIVELETLLAELENSRAH